MAIPFFGEMCALAAALNWAIALVLFKLSGESIPPLSLSLFKNVVAMVLIALTLPFLGGIGAGLAEVSREDLYILILSGVIGIAIADTLLFYSLNLIGVGLVSIVDCAYAPSVILFAWLLLSEEVSTHDYIGGALVLSAVFVASSLAPAIDRTRAQLLLGIFLGLVAVVLMALGIVMVKPILEVTSVVPAAMVRLVAGTIVLAVMMSVRPNAAALFRVFKPSAVWRTCIPASVFGTYFAMLFWVAGYKYTEAGIAAILNQTATIMALVFATLILHEPFTRRKLMAALLGVAGVVVVAVLGSDA